MKKILVFSVLMLTFASIVAGGALAAISPSVQASAEITSLAHSIVSGDYKTVCATYTKSGLAKTYGGGVSSCLNSTSLHDLKGAKFKVQNVQASASKASAVVTFSLYGAKIPWLLNMVKVGGHYKVA